MKGYFTMEFGEKIKELRLKNQLTQEKFAINLNVTRQAVSNWENNRNLPDLEMLILISNIFHVSLDELILGENKVNNMTQKLITDSSETRRVKLNMVTTLTGTLLLLLGLICFFIKANSVEYIDKTGTLHENFYLLPIGFILVLSGIIVFLITGVKFLVDTFRKREKH